jgi:SAM-dependent methyltransferase
MVSIGSSTDLLDLNRGSTVKVQGMTASTPTPAQLAVPPPNHHAAFPAFAGVSGLVAALTFTVGRVPDAELAIRLTDVGPGDDIVDIGCGPGVAVRRAASAGARTVVGIDPAPVMLRAARSLSWGSRRHRAAVRYLHGAAEELPLPDHSASVVWSLATVHHWRDLDAGLGEARRVLRPSGRLLAIERRVEHGASGHATHGWTEDQAQRFAELCHSAGFASVDVGHHLTKRRPVLTVRATAP